MKLILSSCDFINDKSKQVILDNLPKDLKDIKVLFIPSGKATKEDFNCSKYYDRLIDDGFSKKNIYILDYYNITPSMNLNIDVLYVGGGNTFLTLDKIRTTGFDKYIINYLNNGVTYIGGSAGAHIVTKNIEHILPFDENIPNITDFNALGLFNGILFCHYTNDRKKYYDKAIKDNKYNVFTLTNEQSIVVDNDKVIYYK